MYLVKSVYLQAVSHAEAVALISLSNPNVNFNLIQCVVYLVCLTLAHSHAVVCICTSKMDDLMHGDGT